MKNRKAFTLVEILSVIVILGILSTIGIVTIINIRKTQENKFNQTQYQLFLETGKRYFSDHKLKLPIIPESTSKVYLQELVEENYIDSLLDYNKKSFQVDKSYVEVKKIGSEYAYCAKLYQEGKNVVIPGVLEDKYPTKITFEKYRTDNNDSMNLIDNIYYTNRTAQIDMKIEDSDGIKAFQYVIYKNSKKIYTGEFINPNSIETLDVITLDINNYGYGTYQIEVIVYDNAESVTSSKSSKIVIQALTIFKIGDYVKMTPTKTTYKISKSKTGYDSDQTIKPNELKLWRVIRINDDNTVDMVSEYVSSTEIYFQGKTGYKNFVGALNLLAKQYENSTYTIGSRHMGYNGQTEYITDSSSFKTTVPQQARTMSYNVTPETEAKGLGDVWYETDYNLVNIACGTRSGYKVGTNSETAYWIASREYLYYSDVQWEFGNRSIAMNGGINYAPMYEYYAVFQDGKFISKNYSYAIRPIVILKAGITASSGSGTQSKPYVLS